jgi:hypothetical protein
MDCRINLLSETSFLGEMAGAPPTTEAGAPLRSDNFRGPSEPGSSERHSQRRTESERHER